MNKKNQKRLLKDIVDLIKNPLEDQGIYYKHDENNMLHAWALVIGPSDTLYSNGYYLFEIFFPVEYPYAPPKVLFKTNNYNVRFHPNLYRNGKVCLSILNTWRGEQWTSCQSIKTVLLTLVTLFHNKPLLNEPGITETYKYFKHYNDIVQFSNYRTAIIDVLNEKISLDVYNNFKKIIRENFIKNKNNILERLELLKIAQGGAINSIDIPLYNMGNILINYDEISKKFSDIKLT